MPPPLKILVAEDDRVSRLIFQRTFETNSAFSGHEVTVVLANDGKEALDLFLEEHPHLVIVDLLMPRLDGFELCRSIREAPHGQHVPIIATSALWKSRDVLELLKNDFQVEFIAKPIDVADLVALALRVLKA
jgi:CheY-like chemotaxis protein